MSPLDSLLDQLWAPRTFLQNSTGVNRVARKHFSWWETSICITFKFCFEFFHPPTEWFWWYLQYDMSINLNGFMMSPNAEKQLQLGFTFVFLCYFAYRFQNPMKRNFDTNTCWNWKTDSIYQYNQLIVILRVW